MDFRRELSLQRIREVKVRQELENSKLEAEKALRDSRLKSLEIRSSMARMRSSSDSRSTTPLKYRSTGRSITQEEYEEQTLLAEKVQ